MTEMKKPNLSLTTTHKAMKAAGYNAFRVYCQDDNGGSNLVMGWVIAKTDIEPRAGELSGGHSTRAAAWQVAEDMFEIFRERAR